MSDVALPCVLTFASTSHVYRAERTLRLAGIAAGLRPVPQGVASRCGVCLQLAREQLDACLACLGPAQSPVAVYEQNPGSGHWAVCVGHG